jgi:Cu-Zn family superoxide dismutase
MNKLIKGIAVFHPEIANGISGVVRFTEHPLKSQTRKQTSKLQKLTKKQQPNLKINNNMTASNKFKIEVEVELNGLPPGKHGFHIHETGNTLEKCVSCKAHFNPFNEIHGGLESEHRHVGDLGNILANENGEVRMKFCDTMIQLRGTKSNIIGRSLVIHEKEDDLGMTKDNPESKINGLAGGRIACSVVGYAEAFYF